MTTGAAVLGMAMCLPLAMRAQITTPPQESQGVAVPKPESQTEMGRQRRRPNARRQLKRLTARLNLTADQQQQILPILQQRDKQMRAIHDDSSLQPQQRRQQMRDLMQGTRQKLEAVLTDSQKQQYEDMMKRGRERMGNGGMGPNGGPPPPGGQPGNPPPPPPPQ